MDNDPVTMEERWANPWFELTHLDISRTELEAKRPIEVLRVICARTAAATRNSLNDINRPDEFVQILAHLERAAIPISNCWNRVGPPPTFAAKNWFDFQNAKIAALLVCSEGLPSVDGERGEGGESQIAVETLLQDLTAWVYASEAWAAVSFAEQKLGRKLPLDRMKLTFSCSGERITRAEFFLDILRLWPSTPQQHKPNLTGFSDGLQGKESDEGMRQVLGEVFGIDIYILGALLQHMQGLNLSQRVTNGSLHLMPRDWFATRLFGFQHSAEPTIPALDSALSRLENKWLESARDYSAKVFSDGFLSKIPREVALIPVANRNEPNLLLLPATCEVTLVFEAAFDAMRRSKDKLSPDFAELRRKFQTAGSAQIAWHQLKLGGLERQPGTNFVRKGWLAASVGEGKSLAGVPIPQSLCDLDLVIFDRTRCLIIVCECKYATSRLRAVEYRDEYAAYGPDGTIQTEQLKPRVTWIEANKARMCLPGWDEALADWQVDGYILANIAPMSVLAGNGDLPGILTIGSPAAMAALFGRE